jgi:hypothetical protein
MDISKTKSLTVPEIAFIAATRGAIGFGAGLLLAGKFKRANIASSWAGVYFCPVSPAQFQSRCISSENKRLQPFPSIE